MNEITTPLYQRQIADVTQDIRRKTGEFLVTAIEIGRLLFEAKSMVEPGGWSKYIEEELPFSHSWANNYMKLYTEFGSDQTSLFGNSQTFMKLRPTQALEVLRLPADQREAFVESHDVEDMSTRQLRQAVQDELEEERRKHADTQRELESAQAQIRDTNQKLLDAQQVATAAQQATAEAQKQVDAAIREKEAAEAAARDAQDKLMAAQKAEKMNNPDVMSIQVLGQQMLTIWNTIKGHRMKAVGSDPSNAEPINKFLTAVLSTMVDDVAEVSK